MRLAVFLLPLVIGWLLLMIRPFDAHPGWTYLENNCRRGYFLHHHLYQESDTLDLAFIGSSRTMCAFNDSLMAELGSSHQEAVSVANLGTCFYGRDLQYLIVKRLLNRRPVRQIVLEIRATENPAGNRNFAWFAHAGELWDAPLNPRYLSNWVAGTEHRLNWIQQQIQGKADTSWKSKTPPTHAFVPAPSVLRLSAEDSSKQVRPIMPQQAEPSSFARHYLEKIMVLTQEHGVSLHLVYLPAYSLSPEQEPIYLNFYQKMGETHLPPAHLRHQAAWHMDEGHLNELGASAYTRWLHQELSLQP